MRMLVRTFSALLVGAGLLVGARAAEQPLAFDPAQSRVEVAVKASLDSFTAKLTRYEPSVTIDEKDRVTAARFVFQFRDLVTGKDKRDAAMHKWQETERFPDGVFVLSSVEPAAGGALQAKGKLTFHGVTRDIQFPISVTREGPVYTIDGDAPIDTREFGLPIIRMVAVLKVDPWVHVRFHLVGRPTS